MRDIFNNETFRKAGQVLLRKVRDVERTDPLEVESSWQDIEACLKRSRKGIWLRRCTAASSVAAAVLLLCSIGGYFWIGEKGDASLSVALLENGRGGYGDEIVLIKNKEHLCLKDESTVLYDANGVLNIAEPLGAGERTVEKEESLDQVIVPKGKRVNITFSDGTRIHINADSRVIFPSVFAKDKREILVEGEVYLDVRKEASRPFIVKTNGFDVKVLGTQFNICAYGGQATASVVLVEGQVEVSAGKSGKSVLAPNQLLELSDKGASIKEVDVFEYICWKDNQMCLNDRKAGEVFDKLAHYYGRTIWFDDAVRQIPVSGKLDLRENPEEVVSILCQSLFLGCKIDDRNRIIISK